MHALALHGGAGGLPRDGISGPTATRLREGLAAALEAGRGVERVRHPVELARAVMERSGHVLLVGAGAEEFALEHGLALVPSAWFRTHGRETGP